MEAQNGFGGYLILKSLLSPLKELAEPVGKFSPKITD